MAEEVVGAKTSVKDRILWGVGCVVESAAYYSVYIAVPMLLGNVWMTVDSLKTVDPSIKAVFCSFVALTVWSEVFAIGFDVHPDMVLMRWSNGAMSTVGAILAHIYILLGALLSAILLHMALPWPPALPKVASTPTTTLRTLTDRFMIEVVFSFAGCCATSLAFHTARRIQGVMEVKRFFTNLIVSFGKPVTGGRPTLNVAYSLIACFGGTYLTAAVAKGGVSDMGGVIVALVNEIKYFDIRAFLPLAAANVVGALSAASFVAPFEEPEAQAVEKAPRPVQKSPVPKTEDGSKTLGAAKKKPVEKKRKRDEAKPLEEEVKFGVQKTTSEDRMSQLNEGKMEAEKEKFKREAAKSKPSRWCDEESDDESSPPPVPPPEEIMPSAVMESSRGGEDEDDGEGEWTTVRTNKKRPRKRKM